MDELIPRDIVLHSCQTKAVHMVAMMYSLVLLPEMRDHLNKLKSKLEIIMEKKCLILVNINMFCNQLQISIRRDISVVLLKNYCNACEINNINHFILPKINKKYNSMK